MRGLDTQEASQLQPNPPSRVQQADSSDDSEQEDEAFPQAGLVESSSDEDRPNEQEQHTDLTIRTGALTTKKKDLDLNSLQAGALLSLLERAHGHHDHEPRKRGHGELFHDGSAPEDDGE